MSIVADTSVFIVLDRIGHLDLLPRLFGSVVRPRSVLDELLAGDAAVHLLDRAGFRLSPALARALRGA